MEPSRTALVPCPPRREVPTAHRHVLEHLDLFDDGDALYDFMKIIASSTALYKPAVVEENVLRTPTEQLTTKVKATLAGIFGGEPSSPYAMR